jgi:ribokinase
MTGFDVVGFGALNVDKLFKVNKIAAADEESSITEYEEAAGGSAGNTIVGLARLGCRVGFLGKIAGDAEGRMLIEGFSREGVDTTGIAVAKKGRSGTVMGFIDPKGERALYVNPGVNDSIELDESSIAYASHSKFLHLTSFVGEKSFNAQIELVRKVSRSTRIGLDPGALYARKGFAALRPLVKAAYVVLPNVGELEALTGKVDYRKGAGALLNEGVHVVAVKLGSEGCYVTSREGSCLIEPLKVRVVDTTGAGDAFNAGFIYGLINRKSLSDCGRLGNFVASRCIMKMGARTALPTLADLKRNCLA